MPFRTWPIWRPQCLKKTKLIPENVDLKAVCEELMAMVEGGSAAA
jgi:hypothetical protein